MPFQRRGGFCHLHQRENSLLHSCASGTAKEHHRQLLLRGPLHRKSDLLPDCLPHASHKKPGITNSKAGLFPENTPLPYGDAFFQTCLFFYIRKLFLISRKLQGVAGLDFIKPGNKAALIAYHTEPVFGSYTEIASASHTDIIILNDLCPI